MRSDKSTLLALTDSSNVRDRISEVKLRLKLSKTGPNVSRSKAEAGRALFGDTSTTDIPTISIIILPSIEMYVLLMVVASSVINLIALRSSRAISITIFGWLREEVVVKTENSL